MLAHLLLVTDLSSRCEAAHAVAAARAREAARVTVLRVVKLPAVLLAASGHVAVDVLSPWLESCEARLASLVAALCARGAVVQVRTCIGAPGRLDDLARRFAADVVIGVARRLDGHHGVPEVFETSTVSTAAPGVMAP